MATISVPSSLQGKSYSIKIAGDTPTPEEQARIGAFVAQRDAQLSKFMSGSRAAAEPEPEGGVGSALGVGVDMLQQAYGSAVEGAGSSLGLESLRDYGKSVSDFNSQQIQEATPGLTGYEDVDSIGSGLKYFGETLAKQVPQLGVSLAGAGAGAAIGSAVPFIGTGIGAIAGGALANLPYFYGSNRERQKEADIAAGRPVEVDEGVAFLSAIPQATLDSVVDKMLVGKLLKPAMVGAGGIFTRAVKGAGTGIAAEVPTEIGQQMIERAQAGLPLDSDDAIAEYAAVARETAIVGGSVGSVANVAGGDSRVQEQKKKDEEAARQIREDQEDDAKDIMDKIGLGQKSMEAPVEDEAKPDIAGLLPPPTVGTAPTIAPTAPKATSGIQLEGVDDAIANGVANLKVKEDGKEVPFKTFALSVDGNRAEVGFVEKQQSARKGIGRDAYVALGNDLSGRGITLQSTETLLKDGNALWKGLEKSGNATYNPSTKRFEFKPNAAPQAAGTAQTAPTAATPPGKKLTPEEIFALVSGLTGSNPNAAPQAAGTAAPSFRWKQYQATLQNIGQAKAPTILAIQKAAEAAGSGPVTPAVARDIRSQMERDGVVKPSAKVKGGYEYQPNVTPQVDRAESYRRTIQDVTREAQDARTAREKAVQDARRAEQTGKKADARKFMLEVDKADQAIATADRTVQEVSARLQSVQQEQAVPTTQQPGSPMEGRQKFAPITEAPPEVQSRAVTSRGQRLRQAMSYYQDQAKRQGAELRRLQEAQKKVQLPKSEIKRMEELKASIAQATGNVKQIGQRLADPTADIAENEAQQKAIAAKEAAAQAERANKTPIYGQREGQIFTALRKRLNNLGLKDVQLVAEKMLKPETASQGALYEGLFDVKDGNRVIAVAMGIYDPNMTPQQQFDALSEVMNHEVIHALKNLGLFTDAEWKTLTDLAARQQFMKAKDGKVVQRNYTYLQRAKQMYSSETPDIQVEEAIAEMFRDYVAGRLKIGGRPKTLMERIKGFFTSIWKSHEDAGITDPNQIFEGVRFGRIGSRERVAPPKVEVNFPEGSLIDQLLNGPDSERASRLIIQNANSDPDFRKWFRGSTVVDADGDPLIVYHGTDVGEDFSAFRPGSFFTTHPDEASAYSNQFELARKMKAEGKYRVSTAPELAGKRLEYHGTPDDIEPKKVGKVYATDMAVMRYRGKGSWDIISDLAIDYNAPDVDGFETVPVVAADRRAKAQSVVDEYDAAVKSSYPGGDSGRVYPAFLNIKNPLRLDPMEANRLGFRLGATEEYISAAIAKYKAQGYDGIITESDEAVAFPEVRASLGGTPTQYIIFNKDQMKSVFASGADGKGDMLRYSKLSAMGDTDAGKDVGGRTSGTIGEGEVAGRQAGQPTSKVVAPRSDYGGTDFGGLTLADLDELSPDFFERPGWSILTATAKANTDEQNAMMHERLKQELVNGNIPYREVYGVYEGTPDGVSYIVLMDEPSAVRLGARYDQDSVLTNRGLIYARSPMPRNIRNEGIAFYGDEARSKDFYSDIGDGRAFSLDMDWSTGPDVPDIGPGYYTLPERPQLPIRAADGKVELHHWSGRKLKNVDPKKAGTGPLQGEERRRGAELGFFGIMPRPDERAQGTGYVKETGLGEREHIALVDPKTLYPYFTDPDNLSEGLDLNGPDFQNEYEDRIKEAGYKGYYTERFGRTTPLGAITPFRSPLGNVAAMFYKTPVKPVQEVQLGLRNQTRYSVRRRITTPLTKGERSLTVLDRMNPTTAEFISDGKKRDVVQALTDLFNARDGVVIDADDDNAVRKVSRLMLAELRMALIRSPEAIGWYGTTLAKAKRVAAILHPEISPVNPYSGAKSNSYDPIAEHAWDLAMAITSNGMAVSENAKFANRQYEYWKENGFYLEEGTGDQGTGMVAAFQTYNAMKRRMTDAQIAAFLSQKMTVRQLKSNPIIVDLDINVGTSEAIDATINGSYIFGPKIGQGFYQNLRGNFDPLTMDLWFMRMFNRLTGRPFKQVSDELLAENAKRVVAAANAEDISDYDRRVKRAAMAAENIDIVTEGNADRFAIAFDTIYQRDFKKFYDDAIAASGLDPKSTQAKEIGKAARPRSSEMSLSAKTYRGNLGVNPQDAPRGSADRAFMREVVDEVRSALANEGLTISTADIQAVMWYAEKQLFAAMGVRPGKGGDNDYVDGAIELLRSKGIEDAEISRSLPAAERDRISFRTATERTAARVRGGADADGAVQEGSRTEAVPGEAVRGGEKTTPRNGRKRGLKERASVRYSTISPASGARVLSNQSNLMYAKSADFIAKRLNLWGYGVEMKKAQEFTDGVLRRFQDSMIPIGRMVQELSQAGLTITDAMDTYLQEALMHGIVGQRVTENQKVLFQPLLDAVKGLNVPKAKIDALVTATNMASAKGKGFLGLALERYNSPRLAVAEAFLYARHAKERNRFVEENRDIANQNGSGMTDAEANAILNWVLTLDADSKNSLDQISKKVRMIVDDTNRTRVDAGLISAEVAGLDEETVDGANFKHYVPLRGKFGEDADDKFSGPPSNPLFGAKGKEDPKMLGRFDYGADIIANLMTQNQNAILRGERNKVGQSFLNLLRADPAMTGSYASILDRTPTIRTTGKGGKIVDRPDPRAAQDPDILVVKEKGKQTWVRFTDLGMAGAMNGRNGMSPVSNNVMLKAMQTLNRYLSTINTSYNPEFIITNFFRDLQTGLLNMNQFELDGVVKDVIGNLRKAGGGIRSVIRKDDDTSEWAKVYKDYMAAGGQNVTNEFNTLADQMNNIQSTLGDISQAGLSGKWAKVKNGFVGKQVGSMIHLIEDYNTIAENTIRVSAYKALLDRGFSKQRAAQAARNLTVNFAKGGDYRQFMGAWSLFYNASLQGSFALLNAAVRSPRVRKLWLGIIAAGIVQDQLNAMFSDEDEDGKSEYDQIPDHILERNFILPDFLGITGRSYITIPMPYGLNMAHNLGRATSAALRGAKDPGEASMQILMNVLDTVNPLGGTESFYNFAAPTIADPFVDLVENKDFANRDIYKEALPFDKTPQPDSQMYWSTTSPSAVWISNMLNDMTGGNAVRPGFVDWSPDVLEYWFGFVTGGIGRFAQSSIEAPLTVMREGVTDENVRQVPLVRKLLGSVSSREDTGEYIEGAKRVLMAGEELKKARETGDLEWARETIQNYGQELRLLGPIKSFEAALRKVSTQRNKIINNPNIPEDQRRLLLDRLDERRQMILSKANQLLGRLE